MDGQPNPKSSNFAKRGLFQEGIWHCDCSPRLPADKFQVKNGGKNHGRWFYTCQKPQPSRCGFFLWSDHAKIREKSAVMNNSRSESEIAQPAAARNAPQTPRKQQKIGPLLTPSTKGKPYSPSFPPETDDKATSEDDEFAWSSGADEDLAEIARGLSNETTTGNENQEFSRKAARTPQRTSPSKRINDTNLQSAQGQGFNRDKQWSFGDDVFTTPSTMKKPDSLGPLLSPIKTPPTTNPRIKIEPEMENHSIHAPLTIEVLRVLAPVKTHIPLSVEHDLKKLLDCHDLRTQGISKGRDITRLAVQAKEKKIAELQAQIAGLEAEKETYRTVITHLKQDIATSPKKAIRFRPELSKSSV